MIETGTEFQDLPIGRDRDQFLRELLRELSGTLENVIGLDEAEGFISIVGSRMGDMMNAEYTTHMGGERLTLIQVAAALVDLKRRIGGNFTVDSLTDDAIVLVNSKCPFGEYVKDRPSLCMMTSNVFGRIAAENNGYAKVQIDEAIARGHHQCRIVISLRPDAEKKSSSEREYFQRVPMTDV